MRRPLVLLAVAVAVSLVAAACGDDDDVVEAGEEHISHPDGDELVLQVRRTGGFRPADEAMTDVPSFTLLGNGRMIVEGAQIAIFPPPILPPLFEVEVSEEGIQTILEAAAEVGLLDDPPDYGRPPIADATTTIVTAQVEDRQFTHEIFALTETTSPEVVEDPVGVFFEGLSEEIVERRQAIAAFLGLLTAPGDTLVDPGEISDEQPYQAEAFAISSVIADPEPPGDLGQEIEVQTVDWPLEVPLSEATPCLVIDGPEAEELAGVLADATTLTRFRSGDELYTLQVRPLLPNEDDCDDVLPPA